MNIPFLPSLSMPCLASARSGLPLLLCCLMLLAAPVHSQNVGGGLILGLNASQIDGDRFAGFQKAGLNIGGFVYYAFSPSLRLQPEIVFEQLGSANEQELIIKMNYISVPVLLNITVPLTIGASEQPIEVHAGPVIGILLKATNFLGDDQTDFFDNTDLRGVVGVAYRLGGISLGVRYGYSILSFTPSNSNVGILQPGSAGLFHHYANFSLRWHLFD